MASRVNIIVIDEEVGQLQEDGGSQIHSLGGQKIEAVERRGNPAEIFPSCDILLYS